MNLITGATGIVGSQLVLDLLRKGEPVRSIKRNSSNTEALEYLFKFEKSENLLNQIEWVECDINHTGILMECLKDVKRVFHCAAYVSFDPRDNALMEKTNVEGTRNLVNCCLESNIAELVYVSSTAAIGKQKKGLVIHEKLNWDSGENNSFYSYTKYMSELEVWRAQEEGMNVVVVNPAVIIGPGEWGKSSTNVFASIYKGLLFYSGGSNAFVDVRDVTKAMIALSEQQIFNQRFLLFSENLSFKHFLSSVAVALKKSPPKFKSSRFMASIAWRVSWFVSLITQIRPLITKHTARAAVAKQVYSNESIIASLNFEFIPVETAIKRTAEMFLLTKNKG
jgi:nucleoside-diphosphate-sugar epimerase